MPALSVRLWAELYHVFFRQSEAEPDEAKVGSTLDVAVDVTNTGSRAGDAVVQLYIHQRAGSASRPVRQLKGFQRVTLAVGREANNPLQAGTGRTAVLESGDEKWVVEPEQFDVWVGGDSQAKLHGEFRLTP